MRNGFSSRTDPAGRAHGNWAVRTQSVLLYLTCNISPSTTCFLHHRARVLLSSQKGQNRHTHYIQFPSFPWKIISSQAVWEGKNKCITFKCPAYRALDWGWCGFALSSAYHRAWYPLTCLWMVMAAFLIRMYFFLISQPRIVFWMRIQAALNLSALIFSR